MNITQYAKALLYIALAAVTFLVTALVDSVLSVEEIWNLVIVVVGAIVVYLVPNLPTTIGQYAKTIAAFVTAFAVALLSFLTGGITVTEWLQIILAAFAGVGVYIIPNEPQKLPAA